MISYSASGRHRRRIRGGGRFVRERDAALDALLDGRPMLGPSLQVEIRRDTAILWHRDTPLAARLGVSMLVRHGADPGVRAALEDAASAERLTLQPMGEQRLWTLLGDLR